MNEDSIRFKEILLTYHVLNDSRQILLNFLKNKYSLKGIAYQKAVVLSDINKEEKTEEAKTLLENAETELIDQTIVSLVSEFENIIFNHPKSLLREESGGRPRGIEKAILHFESAVPEKIFEHTSRLCEYRNWVAHGKRWEKPNFPQPNPPTAYQVLCDFLSKAEFGSFN